MVSVQHIRFRLFRLSVPHEPDHPSVFTPRSSNRMCGFPASGLRRKAHDVIHGRLLVRGVKQTKPGPSCRHASGNRLAAGHFSLCSADNR